MYGVHAHASMGAPVWLAPPEAWASCSGSPEGAHGHAADAEGAHDPMLAGKTLLIVLCGSRGRRRLLHSLRTAGLRLICYAPSVSAWAQDYIQDWIVGPVNDADAAHAAVSAWMASAYQPPCDAAAQHDALNREQAATAGRKHIDGLLCYDEYGLQLACRLAHALGLPASTCSVTEVVRNKRLFREACMSAGIHTPRFVHLSAPAAPEHPEQLAALTAAGIHFPVVAKPSGCAGSFSVTRADDLEQLRAATQLYWDGLPAYIKANGLSPTSTCATGGMVVEELISGQEVDVDCVVVNGRLLFASVSDNNPCKAVDGLAAFVETGGCCPSALPAAAQEQLLQLTADVVCLFGDSLSGVLHFEAKYDPSKQLAVPIELNARIGGAETFTNVKTVWGVDLARAAARIACGLLPQLPDHLYKYLQAPCKHCLAPMPAVVSVCGAPGAQAGDCRACAHCEYINGGATAVQGRVCCSKVSTCSNNSGSHSNGAVAGRGDSASHTCLGALTECGAASCCDASCSAHCCQDVLCQHHHHPSSHPCQSSQHHISSASDSAQRQVCSGRMAGEHQDDVLQRPMAFSDPAMSRVVTAARMQEAGMAPHLLLTSRISQPQGFSEAAEQVMLQPPPSTTMDQPFGLPQLCIQHTCSPGGNHCSNGNGAGTSVCEQQQGCSGATAHVSVGSACMVAPSATAVACASLQRTAPTECRSSLGYASCLRPAVPPLTHVASINFVPEWSGEGVVEVLEVTPDLMASHSYIDHELYYKPGDIAKLPPAGFSALGWMVAHSPVGVAQAAEELNRLMAQGVVIKLRKPADAAAKDCGCS